MRAKAIFINAISGALLCLILCTRPAAGESITAYHIGNSTTRELPKDDLADWAASRGHVYQAGQHVQNGARLAEIWSKNLPTEVALPPFGSFRDELPTRAFDVLTLSPFYDTIDSAEARIADFRSLAVETEQVYVYQIWPRRSLGDYRTVWDAPWADDEIHSMTREYFSRLLDRLPSDTRIIPTGEVLHELAGRIESLPGIGSMADFYEVDSCTCHLNDHGNFVLASTVYATLFAESPVGLPGPEDLTAEATEIIQQVAWQIVSHHRQTGVTGSGDFDGDGAIAVDDYSRWKRNYGLGISDASGYTTWRNAFDALPPIGTPVPEPRTLVLAVAGLGLLAIHRR